jgi:hypothetical protein
VADQTGSGTLSGGITPGMAPHSGEAHQHGRPISWVAITIICVGFIIGGIGMVPHPKWWLFWTGAGIVVVGSIMTAAARTFQTDWY